jgi:hypothetical protein
MSTTSSVVNAPVRSRYKPKLVPKGEVVIAMDFARFARDKISLVRYRTTDLKKIARHNNLMISGNKTVLVPRITAFFEANMFALRIQKCIRGTLARLVLRLRAKMQTYRSGITNEVDFYTMESVSVIPAELFVAYEVRPGLTFAFNVFSLMLYYKTKGVCINPYTREILPRETTLALLRFYLLTQAVFAPQIRKLVEGYGEAADIAKVLYTTASRAYAIEFSLHASVLCKRSRSLSWSSESGMGSRDSARAAIMSVRRHSVDERIGLAFCEISQLGTTVCSNWFRNLSKHAYVRFYNCIYNLWRYSGEIMPSTKESICCLGDPFNYRFITRFVYSEHTIDQVRELCISLVEELVFTGVNIDFRRLGALHVLSALTSVSLDARENIPWMADSVM